MAAECQCCLVRLSFQRGAGVPLKRPPGPGAASALPLPQPQSLMVTSNDRSSVCWHSSSRAPVLPASASSSTPRWGLTDPDSVILGELRAQFPGAPGPPPASASPPRCTVFPFAVGPRHPSGLPLLYIALCGDSWSSDDSSVTVGVSG